MVVYTKSSDAESHLLQPKIRLSSLHEDLLSFFSVMRIVNGLGTQQILQHATDLHQNTPVDMCYIIVEVYPPDVEPAPYEGVSRRLIWAFILDKKPTSIKSVPTAV